MAKVATHNNITADALMFRSGAQTKRKTPSELRGEQLKRKNVVEIVDESAAPLLDSFSGNKKPEFSSHTKYKDTRIGDVYQVKKSRMQMLSGKDNAKEGLIAKALNLTHTEQPAVRGGKLLTINKEAKDDDAQGCPELTAGKHNASAFRSVAELSLGNKKLSEKGDMDMGKALKGFVASKFPDHPSLSSDSSKWPGAMNSINLCHEITVHIEKTPLDLTLKSYIRVVSSSSVSGLHRSIMGSTFNGMTPCRMQKGDIKNPEDIHSSGSLPQNQIYNSKALYSWVYPQSSLPPSVIQAFSSLASEGGEMDFLNKRYMDWEDALRCLYYMLRKNACNLFYVCTAQFVVMFTSSARKEKTKISCRAYVSKSTRGLRSLLKEHDVCFTMPLCQSRMEEATMEDLAELSEIEKHNLGQTRRLRSSADVDGTSQSLLSFDGNRNVHGLYDFMLNHRSLLSTLTSSDVPMLYSPVMFQNASLHTPEIQCRELNKLDHSAQSLKESYSVEVRDTYLPPWITSNLCAIMGSDGTEFKASFTTEPTSAGLNVALKKPNHKSEETEVNGISAFEIPNTFIASEMCSAVLKGLKYCDKSFSASLSRV